MRLGPCGLWVDLGACPGAERIGLRILRAQEVGFPGRPYSPLAGSQLSDCQRPKRGYQRVIPDLHRTSRFVSVFFIIILLLHFLCFEIVLSAKQTTWKKNMLSFGLGIRKGARPEQAHGPPWYFQGLSHWRWEPPHLLACAWITPERPQGPLTCVAWVSLRQICLKWAARLETPDTLAAGWT